MSSTLSRLVSILIVVSIIAASASAGYYYYSQTQHSTPSSTPSNSTSTPAFQSSSPSTPTSPSSPSSSSTSPSSPPSSSPNTTSTPTPTAPIISMSNLVVDPSEAWPNSLVTISAQLSNTGITGSISLALQINGATIDNRTIQIANGTYITVQFNATETATGRYNIRLGTLTGAFTVVPTGTHTLTVNAAYSGLTFTLDNQTETTPFSILLRIGTYHTIVMPAAVDAYTFQRWEDGSTSPTRTITLTEQMSLTAYFSGANGRGSCPSLYVWNGTEYTYASEISDGPGWLGLIDYYNPDGTITFAFSNPWSYIKLDSTQLQQTNGNYRMAITEDSDEIFYLDSVKLVAVDHPSNADVYSTRGTYLNNLAGQGTIYTVSKSLFTPVSAVNNGEDVLSQINKQDGNYTVAQRWTWNTLDLNLGKLTGAQQINLLVTAVIAWPTNQAGGD